MKKKIITLCLVVALAATAIIGGTLAYFTDTDEKTNTFTVGNVDISIQETFEDKAKMYPGVDVEKNVAVTVEDKSEESWVWVTYTMATDFYNMVDLKWSEGTKWTAADVKSENGTTVVTCKYDQKMAGNTTTDLNLVAVTLKAGVSVDENMNLILGDVTYTGPKTIYVNAYAIQTAGIDSVEAAYTAYNEG